MGCLFVFIIDNNWRNAAVTSVIAVGLTAIGMIHSPSIVLTEGYVFETNFIIAYAICAVGFLIMHLIKFNHKAHEADLEAERQAELSQAKQF